MKKLSVITPLYNTKIEFLQDLENCLRPYQEEIEWILVNDSPDNSELRKNLEYLKVSGKVIVTNDRNRGIFYAYYQGYMKATSPYCCILDHDDIFNPKNVLDKLDGDWDLVYTDEYKFDQKGNREVYHKPDFDMLSSVFYFYTHHVTVMRTNIIQNAICKKGVSGDYTSIFDIHLMLEYMACFVEKDMKVLHIKSADYGWRIHDESTAKNLNQKLAGYFEREQKVEEFLKEQGETPLLNIHKAIGYLIEGCFLSAYDKYKIPLKFNEFKNFIHLESENSVFYKKNQKENFLEEDKYFFNVILRTPFCYLEKMKAEYYFFPIRNLCEKIGKTNYVHHIKDVPFIKSEQLEYFKEGYDMGIWIKRNTENIEKGKVICIMMKV